MDSTSLVEMRSTLKTMAAFTFHVLLHRVRQEAGPMGRQFLRMCCRCHVPSEEWGHASTFVYFAVVKGNFFLQMGATCVGAGCSNWWFTVGSRLRTGLKEAGHFCQFSCLLLGVHVLGARWVC